MTKGNLFKLISADAAFKSVLSNSKWLFASNLVTLLLSFFQGILIARWLGAEKLGTLTLITVFTATVNQFLDSRVWETAIKFVIKYRENNENQKAAAAIKLCYIVDGLTGLLAFLVLVLSAGLASRLFMKDVSVIPLIQFYALSIIIGIPVGTSSAILRIGNRFDWLAYQASGMAALRFVSVLVAVMFSSGIAGILSAYLATAGIAMLVLFLMARKMLDQLGFSNIRRSRLYILKGEFKKIFSFLFATNMNALFKMLQRNADTLLIGFFLNSTSVGYFRVARSLTDLMSFPTNPLYTASYPEFARLWHQKKVHQLRLLLGKLTIAAVVFAGAGLLIVLLGGRWLVQLAVGQQYLPATEVLYWLALGVAISVAMTFGHPFLLALGRAKNSTIAIGVAVIVQLCLLLILLPKIGIMAAGLSYIVHYLIWATIVFISIKDIIIEKPRIRTEETWS